MSTTDVIHEWYKAVVLIRELVDIKTPKTQSQVTCHQRLVGRAVRLLADIDARKKKEKDKRDAHYDRYVSRFKAKERLKTRFDMAPAVENGVDHGSEGKVLLRNDTLRLVWRPGSNYTSGQTSQYAPAELEAVPILDPQARYRMPTSITNNFTNSIPGKKCMLSQALIKAHAETINKLFGAGAADKLLEAKLKRTVVL